MKLTKYTHACLVLEHEGRKLIIDPGNLTTDLPVLHDVAAVVITHGHPDHFDLPAIREQNQGAALFIPSDLADQLQEATVVGDGDMHTVGPFNLQFIGHQHAVIHPDIPVIRNTGVFVNDTLFYPGDSFTIPTRTVPVLAIPAHAPWASIADTIEYLQAVKPQRCFPTHDALLSAAGHTVYGAHLERVSREQGTDFTFLRPGDALEL